MVWFALGFSAFLGLIFLVDEAVLAPPRERRWLAEQRAEDAALDRACRRYYVSDD